MADQRDRHRRLAELFDQACALGPEDQAAFIRDQCGHDEAQRKELESLLRADLESRGDLRVEIPASLAMMPERIARYRLIRVLGEGGFGVVYLAEQTEPIRREVALKVIKPGMDSLAIIARFRAERQVLALMKHPNVAQVFDAGTTERGLPFFAMEFVLGSPITTFCDERKLRLRDRLRLFAQVCTGVQHAHQKGVIHRDLKPSNILVAETAEGPVPKIIDFGVSKATDHRQAGETVLTEQGVFVGTPDYMSPEQIDDVGGSADTRADVYGLGVVLFELLAGRVPFELSGVPLSEIHRVARDVPAPRPSNVLRPTEGYGVAESRGTSPAELARELRGELEWIPLKALSKDPDERYLSAQAMREDIERFLGGLPLVARPPTRRYVVRKFVARHRAAVGATASASLLVLLLLIGLAAATVITQRALTDLRASRESEQYEVYCARLYGLQTAERLDDVRNIIGMLEACPEHLRGWEWRYLDARTDRSLLTLTGHTGTVISVAASSDGRQIVTASRDGSVRSWRRGREEWRQQIGTQVFAVGLDPSGTRVVIGGSGGLVHIRSAADGRLLSEVPHAKGNSVRAAVFDPSGERIVTGARDGIARVWDAATVEMISSFDGHSEGLTDVVFTPDGDRVISCSADGTAREWDAVSGEEVRVFEGHSGDVQSVELNASGDRLVTASLDGTARVWDRHTGELLAECVGHTAGLWYADISPDGSLIATGAVDRSIRLWDGDSGNELIRLRGHTAQVECVQFVASRGWMVTGSRDRTARVWDTHPERFPEVIPIRAAAAPFVAFVPGGKQLALRQRDGVISAFDLSSGTSLSFDSFNVVSELVLLDGVGPLLLAQDATIDRELFSGAPLGPTLRFVESSAPPLVLSADGERTLTMSEGAILLWDVSSGEILEQISAPSSPVQCAALGSPRSDVAFGCEDGSVWLWRADKLGGPRLLGEHSGPVKSVSFDGTGSRVVSTSEGDRVGLIWATDADAHSQPIVLAGHDHTVVSARFSPDGTRVVSASCDNTARIWDASTGVGLLILEGHTDWVQAAAFSADGTRVLTASRDGTARIWDSVPRRERLAGGLGVGD